MAPSSWVGIPGQAQRCREALWGCFGVAAGCPAVALVRVQGALCKPRALLGGAEWSREQEGIKSNFGLCVFLPKGGSYSVIQREGVPV